MLEQSDATGWMGMFCLNLMRIALELAKTNKAYESTGLKFFEHYIYIGSAMKHMGGRELLTLGRRRRLLLRRASLPRRSFEKFRVRSLVGIIPLYAVEELQLDAIEGLHEFRTNFLWFVNNRAS